MSFWPEDITADMSESPYEIMRSAGDELNQMTGILTVEINENRLPDRIVLDFIVFNPVRSMKLNLFETSHQLGQTYPVVIVPPSSDIPEFLKRQQYIPGKPGLSEMMGAGSMFGPTSGRYVTNEWVCATPAEFKEKLKVLFSKDYVKSRILSIQTHLVPQNTPDLPENSLDDDLSEDDQECEDGSES